MFFVNLIFMKYECKSDHDSFILKRNRENIVT